ncbi:hypothetical protein FIBSPDRAFT_864004 [Athelia psychrophila]|uniref:Uncharacterized protein n=1 Tax=Athelia psychrophila TaxID=1759441 RepID=A0A166GZG3_9AGAM|nr:hypothetical protein FIBSPDRAFT_864004 [Fibularhizoctonia sp. CBS 109695]
MARELYARRPDARPLDKVAAGKLILMIFAQFQRLTPYQTMGPVRPAMSSFAAQLIGDRLAHEARRAVSSSGGLHAFLKEDDSDSVADIGASLIEVTRGAAQTSETLALDYSTRMAQPY